MAPAERYKLLYCGAFGIPFGQFGTAPPPGMVDTGPGVPAASAYRELRPIGTPRKGRVRDQARGADGRARRQRARRAAPSSAASARPPWSSSAPTPLSLAVQYLTGETFGLFTEMRRVRNRITEALDRRQWPRDAAELYLLAGCLSALMAAAAVNLGYPQAAGELTRAGWAYATVIDHRPLMARLRLCAAYAAYWSGHPEAASRPGPQRARLPRRRPGRGAAAPVRRPGRGPPRRRRERAPGHRGRARRQGPRAPRRTARDRRRVRLLPGHPVLLRGLPAVGGGRPPRRPRELERATGLYAAGPDPGEQHSRRCRMLAHTDLAIARLRAGALDAAIAALEPVLALPPGERTAVQGAAPVRGPRRTGPAGLPRLGPGPRPGRAAGRVRSRRTRTPASSGVASSGAARSGPALRTG